MPIATRFKGLHHLGFKTFRLPRKKKKQLKKAWRFSSIDWREFAKIKHKIK